ncbi:SIMPL domain-containing protein [Actinoplanes sp. NPDC049802]|uniref:SIMPL domain-containing protein n=1 Tax=Actinoplanes sp. NPDC049802 TaxID=3154742 RepID=UPI0033CE49F9
MHLKNGKLVTLVAVVMLSAALLGGRPAAASDSRESVLVSGTGTVFGTPDTFIADFAAEATAATVGEALERATAAAARMRDALLRAGAAKADLQTSGADISARRDDKGKLTGYTVIQGLTARIRNLDRAGATLTETVTAGGDAARLNGVSFAVDDDTALLAEARKRAFADAEAKADLYAREAGRRLGRVVKVTEGNTGGPEPAGSHKYADAAMPVEPGRHRLTATVTVEWALIR